jgi:signal transduction histidine kinase
VTRDEARPAAAPGQPLAVRLALLLAAAVVVVLLVAGLLVNRAVSGSLEETLGAGERARVEFTVNVIADALQGQGPLAGRGVDRIIRQVARVTGGEAILRDADGGIVARAGVAPPSESTETLSEPIPGSSGATLEIRVPSRAQPFVRGFNLSLLVAGALSVVAIVVIGVVVADRLTRPLRGVAAAARRLGAGDLAARAAAGPDRESAELAVAFNAMADRLERSEMLRRRAASDVAHDLATPATVLESQLQAMIDGVVPADRAQLDAARAAAGALSSVVRQLGELAGAEAATLHRRPERVDLVALVGEAVAALDGLARQRNVTVVIDGSAAATADHGHVERALRNVITNGLQHAPPGSRLGVSVAVTPDAAEVRITDAGTGIAQEDLPHVFERFYRADQARSSDAGRRGSGIGLTIARELLAASGGSIDVERTGTNGTTFLIRLPRLT